MKPNQATFDKIQGLILSGQKENVLLAFEIAKGQSIPEEQIIAPWLPLLQITKTSLHLKNPMESLLDLLQKEKIYYHSELRAPLVLNSVPKNIGALLRLTFVSMTDHKFETLPASIGQLSDLEYLNFNGCSLKTLPQSIGQLHKLSNLNLRHNNIECLPDSIGELQELETLNLGSNKLQQLPESFGQLQQLKYLSLASNQLTKLPNSFSQLEKLEELSLHYNLIPKQELLLLQKKMPQTLIKWDN